MKLLLAQGSVYLPSWGGANKSNRLIMELLVKQGHACRVVAPAGGQQACKDAESFFGMLRERRIRYDAYSGDRSCFFMFNGVGVRAILDNQPGRWLDYEIDTFDPDLIIVASEDPGYVLLERAFRTRPNQVVYLARTTMALPAGPAAPVNSPRAAELLRKALGIVAVSEYLKDYLSRWLDLTAAVLPICPNDADASITHQQCDDGFVTIINPCAYKGIDVFLSIARKLQNRQFAAVPTWGTTSQDLINLHGCHNVNILAPSDDIRNILCRTKVLLVPSLWAEAKANVITEAMLHGIPVIASEVGGNREALAGVDYLLPVSPIVQFRAELDERMLPFPVVPEQDVTLWVNALNVLLTDDNRYRAISSASRLSAYDRSRFERIDHLESYLADLIR